jgi:hypothetical protein
MIPYQTKSKKIHGAGYDRVLRDAMSVLDEIKKKTKRRPYVRSAYFKKKFSLIIFGNIFSRNLPKKEQEE